MNPFRSHLCERVKGHISKISEEMNNKKFYIETKYDGERCQLHKKGDKYKYFSRNIFDFTYDYGETVEEEGKFTSFFAKSLDPSVTDVIFDGEMCAWSIEHQCLLCKSDQMNIRQIRPGDTKVQQCLVIYDVVYLNGEVLSKKPLKERIAILEGIVKEQEGRVILGKRHVAETLKEVVESLNLAIERREEGLVIKDMESTYKPGVRNKSGWIKIKPEYDDSLSDDLDLVILGGYYGSSGRNLGKIHQFLMGVSDGDKFLSICRVSSGRILKHFLETRDCPI